MIPKTIYQTWKTQNLPKKVVNLHQKMLKMNSEYEHIIYTNDQMNDYMVSNADKEIRELYFKLNNIVARADIWRYTVLLNKGGIYIDIDSEICKPLSELIKTNDRAIITAEKNKNLFVQWALIFEKNHPILELTLKNILTAVSNGFYRNDHHSLTVKTYANAVFEYAKTSNDKLNWESITHKTDKTFICSENSFRLYGIDYNEFFKFKHKYNHLLRNRKKGQSSSDHWTEEQHVNNLY